LSDRRVAATLAWDHRDPFDRIIAATAIARGMVLISTDSAFKTLVEMPKWPGLVW
jgi:PIN domain nuclease of toxin-antitoxin system